MTTLELQRRACLRGYNDAAKNKDWVSIKDRMPLYKECILVYLDNGTITEAVYRGEYEKNIHIFRLELTHEETDEGISHWMPLPESPQKEKTDHARDVIEKSSGEIHGLSGK